MGKYVLVVGISVFFFAACAGSNVEILEVIHNPVPIPEAREKSPKNDVVGKIIRESRDEVAVRDSEFPNRKPRMTEVLAEKGLPHLAVSESGVTVWTYGNSDTTECFAFRGGEFLWHKVLPPKISCPTK